VLASAFVGVKADAPALLRLVEENRRLRPESPELGWIPVNRELAAWNAEHHVRSTDRTVRYLMVGSETWNFWSLFFPGSPPNDGAVETASAFLRPGPLDALHVVPGRTHHMNVLMQKDSQEWVLSRLDPVGWGERLSVRGLA